MEQVLCGIDQIDRYDYLFTSKRIGLVTTPAGYNKDMKSSIDVFREKYHLTALFSAEFGMLGNKKARQTGTTYLDARTGLYVFNIYGGGSQPTNGMMDLIDVLVFDVQDSGVRYSSFIDTMLSCMQSCARCGKTFVVLDRPNPLGGIQVQGNLPETADVFFPSLHVLPQRYALTTGELAFMLNSEHKIGCDVHVARMENYKREYYFYDTGLIYISPIPTLPTFDSNLLYAGIGMLEGTCLSVGLGTNKPYQVIGAPWIDAPKLAEHLNSYQLPGGKFRPVYYIPLEGQYANQQCKGVQVHITDYKALHVLNLALYLMQEVHEMVPSTTEFFIRSEQEPEKYQIDLYAGTGRLRSATTDVEYLTGLFALDSKQFEKNKVKYHIYE